MEEKIGFAITVPDPTSGQAVQVRVFGAVVRAGGDADPQVSAAVSSQLRGAAADVITRELRAGRVGLAALPASLAHFTPEIVGRANEALQAHGLHIQSAALECTAPPPPQAQAATEAINAAPSVAESVASNLADNLVANAIPRRVGVNIGGFKLGFGDGGGDEDSLAEQAADKAKGQLLHYAILGGVFLFVTFICCGFVGFKIIF